MNAVHRLANKVLIGEEVADMQQRTVGESVQHHTLQKAPGEAPITTFITLTPKATAKSSGLGATFYLLNNRTPYTDLFDGLQQACATVPYPFSATSENTCNSLMVNLPRVQVYKKHCTATKLQKDFAQLSIHPVNYKSADREIMACALFDNEYYAPLIISDALARLGIRRISEPLTSGIGLVSSAFPALPMDQSESANIEGSMVVS